MKNSNDDGKKPSASFIVGAISLVFLIIGYQTALFIHKAAVTKIVADHDHPDTVFVNSQQDWKDLTAESGMTEEHESDFGASGTSFSASSSKGWDSGRQMRSGIFRKDSGHSPAAEQIRLNNTPRRHESFRFNPNTASLEDLMRLGFSLKQAQSIDSYRKKGGRFRRKSDFAKSYVVDDSVFRRLEPYIDIPKIDLNTADSAVFETLPGIGKYFASRMVSYRKELGGYSFAEQLMDIWHFDQEKFDAVKDLVFVEMSASVPYPLWTLPEEKLKLHPYIGKYAAHGVVLFRDNSPKSDWSVENLAKAGILDPKKAAKLARCRIAEIPK